MKKYNILILTTFLLVILKVLDLVKYSWLFAFAPILIPMMIFISTILVITITVFIMVFIFGIDTDTLKNKIDNLKNKLKK